MREICAIFSTVRLRVMQRTVLRRPFCLSVCLFVECVNCDKRKKLVPTFLYMKERLSLFPTRRIVSGGTTPT